MTAIRYLSVTGLIAANIFGFPEVDGPMLDALKKLNGGSIHLPARKQDYPDRDRLSQRFARFKAAS
jgi:hypothetical protein